MSRNETDFEASPPFHIQKMLNMMHYFGNTAKHSLSFLNMQGCLCELWSFIKLEKQYTFFVVKTKGGQFT